MATDDTPRTIDEAYRSAVNATNLKSEERTNRSPSDVLAGMGFADRILTQGFRTVDRHGTTEPVRPAPLAVPLSRLLAGDGSAAREIVLILGQRVWRQARSYRVKLTLVQAEDMARACLAWYREGTCRTCHGHGWQLIPGTPHLSDRECQPCGGSGKRPFESEFIEEHRQLARWAVFEMETEVGRAGPEALRSLAERLDL